MYWVLILNLLLLFCGVCWSARKKDDSDDDGEFGADLISKLKNDANLDLSVDEEYEDLRAELLAYHTALASLTSGSGRRSLGSTPCWELGGICVNYKLCSGFRYLTEIPGCKGKLNVCCFTWNRFKPQDMREHGISNLALPWSIQIPFGGEGIQLKEISKPEKKKKKKQVEEDEEILRSNGTRTFAYIIRADK